SPTGHWITKAIRYPLTPNHLPERRPEDNTPPRTATMDETVWRRYPVNVEALYAILTSKDFFTQRYAWGKVKDYRLEGCQPQGDVFLVRVIQPIEIRVDKLPPFARRLLPARADLSTEFRWRPSEGGYLADYRM